MQVLSSGQIALTRGSILKWIGFSDENVLATYDSSGVLRMESAEFPGCWMPVFDSESQRKSEEVFWIVGIRANMVVCIVCKPETPEPQVRD